jgi:hypothetical protein
MPNPSIAVHRIPALPRIERRTLRIIKIRYIGPIHPALAVTVDPVATHADGGGARFKIDVFEIVVVGSKGLKRLAVAIVA